MADSQLQQVWTFLAEAIGKIDGITPYRSAVRTVSTDPMSLLTVSSLKTPVVVVLYDGERSVLESTAMGDELTHQMVFGLDWRVDAPGLSTVARIQAYSDLQADLETAVGVDETCGGVSWDARVIGHAGPWMDTSGMILGGTTIAVWCNRVLGA